MVELAKMSRYSEPLGQREPEEPPEPPEPPEPGPDEYIVKGFPRPAPPPEEE